MGETNDVVLSGKQADRPQQVCLTALRADHLSQGLALSQALNWPYREEDWRFAAALGQGIVAEVDGHVRATALWWPYGEGHGSMGMIIVDPAMQGQGLGRALMNELLQQAAGRTLILNSTQEGLRLYAGLGFVPYGQIFQHQALMHHDPDAVKVEGTIRAVRPDESDRIVALDHAAAGMDRATLVHALLEVGAVDVLERRGEVVGYACCRRFGHGVVIGPVVAPAQQDAMALIARWAKRHVGTFVRIDIPESSDLSAWLDSIGLPNVGHVVSMVRGAQTAPANTPPLFALANQSLG
jgi:ribosomal protein S18 acetylase RimI-like enzyme